MNIFSATNSGALITILPHSLVDDFFFFGFLGGAVGYAYYIWATRNHPKATVSIPVVVYGLLVSGALGGLLAIVFDRSIELSILVGLLHQFVYLSLVKITESGQGWETLKQIVIKLLTAGTVQR